MVFVVWRRAQRSPIGDHYCANQIEINMDVADPHNRFTDIFRGKRWASLRSAPTYDFYPNISDNHC